MTGTYAPAAEWLILEWYRSMGTAGQVCVQRCGECGRWRHPPRRFCPACHSRSASFEPVAGHGSVVSFVVSHRSMDPGWQARAPYATLVVELPEGPRLLAAATQPPGDVEVGMQVQLRAERRSEDFSLVWAEPPG